MQQFKGVQTSKPLRTNPVQGSLDTIQKNAGDPKDEQLRVSYGLVTKVDDETQRVKIDLFDRGGVKKRLGKNKTNTEGIFVPILQPLQVIHHLYGQLRKGLVVRVWWKGKQAPGAESIAEIVSDQDSSIFRSGSEKTRSNELNTSPHEIFTGGVGSLS